jgi:hypothetical protein
VKRHDLDLVDLAGAAKTLDTSTRKMLVWCRRSDFPQPVAKLHSPRWHRADILKWSKEHSSVTAPPAG